MLLGLRTAIYRTPDLEAGKRWYTKVLGAEPRAEVQDVGEGILAGDVLDPFGNVFGVIESPHFKLPPGGG